MTHLKNLFVVFLLGFASLAIAGDTSVAEEQDAHIIAQLVAAGADVSKPHDVDFFIVASSKKRAATIAKELVSSGYTIVSTQSVKGTSNWEVHAKRSMPLSTETMVNITRTLSLLAEKNGGYYDGWGTTPVK
jgi:regulator of RNase E activity RraB